MAVLIFSNSAHAQTTNTSITRSFLVSSASKLASVGSFFRSLIFFEPPTDKSSSSSSASSADKSTDNSSFQQTEDNQSTSDSSENNSDDSNLAQTLDDTISLVKSLETKYNKLQKELSNLKASGLKVEGQTTNNQIIERTVERVTSGLSQTDLNSGLSSLRTELDGLNTKLTNQIANLSSQTSLQNTATYQAISLSNKIDNLSNVTISNPTVTGTLTNQTFSNSGNATIGGTLTVTGATSLSSLTANTISLASLSVTSAIATSTFSTGGLTVGINQFVVQQTSGNVGIGTTSPYAKLSVVGAGVFDDNVRSSYFTATSTTATSTFAGGMNVAGSSGLTVLQNGKVGIGTTNPWENLLVKSATGIAQVGILSSDQSLFSMLNFLDRDDSTIHQLMQMIQLGSNFATSTSDGNPGSFLLRQMAPTGDIYIFNGRNASGNIGKGLTVTSGNQTGIGTSTPHSKLTVWGVGTETGQVFEIVNNASTTLTKMLDNGTGYFLGNIGIGTTSPYAKLSVAGAGVFDDNVRSSYFTATSTTATSTFAGFIDVLGTGTNATSTFSGNLWVKGTLRAAVSYVGDLIFANNFKFTEADPILTGSNALYLQNQFGSTTLAIDENGNVGIGTTSPAYKLQVMGDIAATSFVNISTRDAKKDITYLTSSQETDFLNKIKTTNIANYHYNIENQANPLRLGLIAEEAPAEILSVDGKGVDVYKMATFTLGGVKALQGEMEKMKIDLVSLQASASASSGTGSDGLFAWITDKFKTALGIEFGNEKIKVKNLCVGETCVTEDQFKAVFGSSQSASSSSSAESSSASSTSSSSESSSSLASSSSVSSNSSESSSISSLSSQSDISSSSGEAVSSSESSSSAENNSSSEPAP